MVVFIDVTIIFIKPLWLERISLYLDVDVTTVVKISILEASNHMNGLAELGESSNRDHNSSMRI